MNFCRYDRVVSLICCYDVSDRGSGIGGAEGDRCVGIGGAGGSNMLSSWGRYVGKSAARDRACGWGGRGGPRLWGRLIFLRFFLVGARERHGKMSFVAVEALDDVRCTVFMGVIVRGTLRTTE